MKQALTSKGITWTDLEHPEPEELAAFVREVNLSAADAEFITQEHQRPEISAPPHYLLILCYVPVFDKTSRVTSGAPLYLVITAAGVWTLCYEPIPVLQKLIEEFTTAPVKQEEYFGDFPLSLALYILGRLTAASFRKLNRLAKHIDIAEDAAFNGNERQMVEEIALLARDVMDFRKIIRPQRSLFRELLAHPFMSETAAVAWRRLANQTEKLWDILENLQENVMELGKTNNAVLQYKQNELLRLLTFYSIISIPALVLISPFNLNISHVRLNEFYFILYWVILAGLVSTLLLIFLRSKAKRVL